MKKIIKLTETDIRNIVKRVMTEQGFGGAAGIVGTPQESSKTPYSPKYPCLATGTLAPFVFYVQKNKTKICSKLGITPELLLILTKTAIGIMKRETDYGTSWHAMGESLLDWFDDTFLNKGLKKSGKLGSVGPGQFTYKTWKDLNMEKVFGMDRDDMRTITGAGLGIIASLIKNYRRAISLGYTNNSRSVNPFLSKKGINFSSTNNAALDLAIVSHNMPVINKYCYTSSPTLAGPCDKPTYDPYKKGTGGYKKYGTLKVYQNKPIKNYFPNKKFGELTAIGYLEEVIKVINSLNCIKL
jgi:hypothetical protein